MYFPLFAYASNRTAHEAMGGGFLAFGLCALWGGRLIYRALRRDILDASGHTIASRGWFFGGGLALQVPLIVFTYFAWKQGFFG